MELLLDEVPKLIDACLHFRVGPFHTGRRAGFLRDSVVAEPANAADSEVGHAFSFLQTERQVPFLLNVFDQSGGIAAWEPPLG